MNPLTQLNMDLEPDWRPDYLPPSAWHEHGMFARWIVSALRPRSLVELGTHNGYSYFVFCSALREYGIPAEAHAVDTWKGDEHAGFYDESVYSEVQRINSKEFADFSTLHRAYFDDVVETIAPRSVDLLHIDGRHGYDDVRHDFESWLPALSERAVVLFHDIAEHQPGFGVHRLWAELVERYPSFTFTHGHGLGVLLVGNEVPDSVCELAQLSEEDAALVRTLHETWGAALASEYESLSLREELGQARTTLAEQSEQLGATNDQLVAVNEQVAAMNEQIRNLSNELASVRQHNTDLQQTLSWRITKPLRAIRRAQLR